MSAQDPRLGEFGFAGDDHVVPFEVDPLDVRGRAVQLGPLLDVPIFEGTGPLGELKAAEARRRQAELEYRRAERTPPAHGSLDGQRDDRLGWCRFVGPGDRRPLQSGNGQLDSNLDDRHPERTLRPHSVVERQRDDHLGRVQQFN